eukprot:gene3036-3317_t
MARIILFIVAMAAYCSVANAVIGIPVVIQFDNTLSRVNSNIKVVQKYVAEKLCRVPVQSVFVISGKDQSSLVNHKSTVTFFCAGNDTKKLINNCNGMWNRHQVKDEIKDHTTPEPSTQT